MSLTCHNIEALTRVQILQCVQITISGDHLNILTAYSFSQGLKKSGFTNGFFSGIRMRHDTTPICKWIKYIITINLSYPR